MDPWDGVICLSIGILNNNTNYNKNINNTNNTNNTNNNTNDNTNNTNNTNNNTNNTKILIIALNCF